MKHHFLISCCLIFVFLNTNHMHIIKVVVYKIEKYESTNENI